MQILTVSAAESFFVSSVVIFCLCIWFHWWITSYAATGSNWCGWTVSRSPSTSDTSDSLHPMEETEQDRLRSQESLLPSLKVADCPLFNARGKCSNFLHQNQMELQRMQLAVKTNLIFCRNLLSKKISKKLCEQYSTQGSRIGNKLWKNFHVPLPLTIYFECNKT